MAFYARRGRPRLPREERDRGTPELRSKQAAGLTCEPIDRCLGAGLISPPQHRSALHLRWLYTLRYGAPNVTTYYPETQRAPSYGPQSDEWRASREQEYREATTLLRLHRRYEAIMRLVIHNELPAFLCPQLQRLSWHDAAMAEQLQRTHLTICEGLELLVTHWRHTRPPRPLSEADPAGR